MLFGLLAMVPQSRAATLEQPISIKVDLTDGKRGLFHSHLVIPVDPGPILLGYAKWIPGELAPNGQLNRIVGLKFSVGTQVLDWHRDDVEIYNFHLQIPQGVHELEADLDFATTDLDEGFTDTVAADDAIAVLNWHQVVLYPVDHGSKELRYRASVQIPDHWGFGTALPVQTRHGSLIQFGDVSLETLMDSPLLTSRNFKVLQLGGTKPVEMDLAAENPEALSIKPADQDHFRRLVEQAERIFGGPRYSHYNMMLTLSNPLAHYTLEHLESSDNRMIETALRDDSVLLTSASLIPHEYVHSWNGKYRVPSGLDTFNYQDPMKADLIWVYEGLTEYIGTILTARSGFWSVEQLREALALDAGSMAVHPGRKWRPLEDTVIAASLLTTAPNAWLTQRRSTDFYQEGALIWLEADTIIRSRSQAKRSLDDFCRLFLAEPTAGASRTYTFDNIVNLMNQVQPFDWRQFFEHRLHSKDPEPPLGGVENAGWKLDYTDRPSDLLSSMERLNKPDLLWPLWNAQPIVDVRFSIGLFLSGDGTVIDVVQGMPGFSAGLSPGMRILSINGQSFTPERIHAAIRRTATGGKLVLIREHDGKRESVNVLYQSGERYPKLVRKPNVPDLLAAIAKAR